MMVPGGAELLAMLQRGGSGRAGESGDGTTSQALYGTAGLLSLLQAGRGDRDSLGLVLGENLASTGLALPSPEFLHTSFANPWGTEPVALEPTFYLPSCYRLPSPSLRREHLQKFDYTTLMYMFYALPRDMLQAFAAQELFYREWRYHKDHKLWFKPEKVEEAGGRSKQVLMYFDAGAWEKKTFVGPNPSAQGWLSEEECRAPSR